MVQKKRKRTRAARNYRPRKKPLTMAQYKGVCKVVTKKMHQESERHTYDEHVGSIVNIGQTPGNVIVKFPTEGVGFSQHIGDSIYLKDFELRGYVDCVSTTNNIMRIIGVQMLDSDSLGVPSLSDVLEDPSSLRHVNSFYKKKPNRKWKILYDVETIWDSNNSSAPRPFSCKLSGKSIKVHKPRVDETNGNIGSIYFWFCGDDVSNGMSVQNCKYRYHYHDN